MYDFCIIYISSNYTQPYQKYILHNMYIHNMFYKQKQNKVNLSQTVVCTLQYLLNSLQESHMYTYMYCYIQIICHVMKLCIAFTKMKEDSY